LQWPPSTQQSPHSAHFYTNSDGIGACKDRPAGYNNVICSHYNGLNTRISDTPQLCFFTLK
jgi:hypothetical protein